MESLEVLAIFRANCACESTHRYLVPISRPASSTVLSPHWLGCVIQNFCCWVWREGVTCSS